MSPRIPCPPQQEPCQCCAYPRSEEHTSELQSHSDLVCRLLLEKKKITHRLIPTSPTAPRRWRSSSFSPETRRKQFAGWALCQLTLCHDSEHRSRLVPTRCHIRP